MTLNIDQPEGSLGDPKWYRSRARSISGNAPARQVPAMDNAAWLISSRLIAGLVLYTGIGFVLSLWLGHRPLLMSLGALIGLGLSYYTIFSGLAQENKVMRVNVEKNSTRESEGDK